MARRISGHDTGSDERAGYLSSANGTTEVAIKKAPLKIASLQESKNASVVATTAGPKIAPSATAIWTRFKARPVSCGKASAIRADTVPSPEPSAIPENRHATKNTPNPGLTPSHANANAPVIAVTSSVGRRPHRSDAVPPTSDPKINPTPQVVNEKPRSAYETLNSSRMASIAGPTTLRATPNAT